MLQRLVSFSLHHRGLVLALALVFAAYGAYVSSRSKLDVFPEFVPPQVDIQTEAAGLAPEQVEQIVTRPLENALLGAKGLARVSSESIQGLSVIKATFKDGEDIFQARQILAERLSEAAGELPAGVKAPKMSPLTSSTMDLLKIGLTSEKSSPMAMRTFADWTLRPRLLAVPGVAKVTVYGGEQREFQVQVDPERLNRYDLSVTDVINAAKQATGVRGAGWVENSNQRIVLQTEGQALTAGQIGQTVVIAGATHNVLLRDVAKVLEAPEVKTGDANIMDQPGVLLALASQYGANTLEVTQALEAALEEMKPALEVAGLKLYPRLHRPATFIENALHNVRHALMMGALFVAIILIFFLLDWRTALISFISIPLSLLTAVVIFDSMGVTLNTMTLGGFVVAIGVVVDDAIIDVENISRRLRENAGLTAPRPALNVVLDASLEVRSAVVYATFVVALMFLPVLMMSGLQGKFFAPLGHAFILSTLASLFVALTVTPGLCLLLLRKHVPHRAPFWIRWLRSIHGGLLKIVCANPLQTSAAAFLFFLASLVTIPWFKSALMPLFREGHFVAQFSTAPGTSLEEMTRLGRLVCHALLANDKIVTVEQEAGRAEQGEDTWGPHTSEFHIELKAGLTSAEEESVMEFVRKTLESFPGTQSEVLTFLGDRIGESISGETAQLAVNFYGDDLDAIDAAAAEAVTFLKATGSATDVQLKSPPGAPRLVVRLRPERLAQYGYRSTEVMEAVQAAYQGAEVGQTYDGSRVTALKVILEPSARRDGRAVAAQLVTNSQGRRMALGELTDIYPATGRYSIHHEGALRRQTVTCNTKEGTDLHAFVENLRKEMSARIHLPKGAYISYEGADEEAAKTRRELYLHFAMAVAAIFIVLTLVFRRPSQLLLVLANVPFALSGGLFCAFASGGTLSIGSMVGFVTLFGISLRNSIMLISHYEHLIHVEGAEWSVATAIRGANERLLPILMTALVTALGLLPLVLSGGEAGSEIEYPMALVILGGLATSTVLNLVVLPALALAFGNFAKRPGESEPVAGSATVAA